MQANRIDTYLKQKLGEDAFDAELAAEAIREHLQDADGRATLVEWFGKAQPRDVADALGLLSAEELVSAVAQIGIDDLVNIIGYLPLEMQAIMVRAMPRRTIIALFEEMSSDERADLFNALPDVQDTLLPALAQAEREDIRRLASYEEGSVGSIMSSQYATLSSGLTAAEAIEELRRLAPDSETIYSAYVLDKQRHLLGVVSLRHLILALPQTRVSDIMVDDPVSARVDDESMVAAGKIARYDFIALPVVDEEKRMVGIVTSDDAMDVLVDEATEDFHKAGGSTGSIPLRMKDASIRLLYRKRVFWLVLLVFANVFSGAGIAHFEDLIAANVALVFFLPLLVDSGGNAGSQSATLMVRALAIGDVQLRDWAAMLGRELGVAALLGLTMSVAVSAVGLVRGGPEIALVVALTMLVVVMTGSLIGMSLPFILSHFKGDPASASSPLITTIADASGILIYFGIASQVLPGLAGGG